MAITTIFISFVNFFVRIIRYILFPRQTLDFLGAEINQLTTKKDEVIREVHRALREGTEPNSQAKQWLDQVEGLESRFVESRDEFRRKLKLGDIPVNPLSSLRISQKAEEMIESAQYLKSQIFFNDVVDKVVPVRFEEMPGAPTVGTDSVIEQMQQLLVCEDAAIIGVYGMGGVGKTALLSRLHNEVLVDANEYDVILSVEADEDDSAKHIQNKLKARLGLSWTDNKPVKERAATIFKALSKTKFVLILDNLWRPVDLKAVGVPIPKPRSGRKVIVSSRSEEVCDCMGTKRKLKLDCLPLEEARKLFAENVGPELLASSSELQELSETVVRKCGGLPLALVTVARSLASKRSAEEWKHFLTVLSTDPSQIPGIDENLLSVLRLSYDELPTEKLMSCASHFSLYWEGCKVHKSLLHDSWIGEGLVDAFTNTDQADNEVCYILGVLSSASLIERLDAQGYTRMHPMVRAAILRAVSVSVRSDKSQNQTKWVVQEKENLTEAPEPEAWRSASRLALGYNHIDTLPESPECPNLLSMKLKNNMNLQRVPVGFFRFMTSLLALDLHSTPIVELPPSIGELVNLQFLELGSTKIKALPKELSRLARMRYLGLNWTNDLKHIPNGVLAGLAELRVLRMTVSYKRWKATAETEGGGVELDELERLNKLRILDITVGTVEALERLTESPRLSASTAAILITRCKGLKTLELPSLTLGRQMKSLKWLRISQSNDIEEVFIGNGLPEDEQILKKIENVVMENLLKARIIWNNSRALENLQGLFIYGCNGMEQLVYCSAENDDGEASGSVKTPFPNLREIALRGLADMKRVSDERRVLVFPRLESFELHECPRMRKLNFVAPKLRVVKSQRTVWSQLEWTDESTKALFEKMLKL